MSEPITPVFDRRIDHPSAWTLSDVGGKEAFVHRIGREHVEALDEILARTKERAATAVTRENFSNGPIDALMTAARHEIMAGKGAVILSGLDMSRYSLEDYERIVWGLGTHIGSGVVQSPNRDLIARVQKEENVNIVRGYTSNFELGPHGDFHEVLSLAAYSRAETGGESGLTSSLAIHNAILAERPDLLAPLYEGFFQESMDTTGLTRTKVPVFCNVDGMVSCYMHIYFTYAGAHKMGVSLPPELTEALDLFAAHSKRDDLWARFMLEPGDILFWHNFTNLHSRTGFTNSGRNKRLLLRLWLNVANGRPMIPEFTDRQRYMDIEHVQGRPGVQYGSLTPPATKEPVTQDR